MALLHDRDVFLRIANHVFLPPQLPHEEDKADIDAHLIRITAKALSNFRDTLPHKHQASFKDALAALRYAGACNSVVDGHVNETELHSALKLLRDNESIPLRIRAQNAGVIITKTQHAAVFECFELAPRNEEVLRTKGRLTRTFPERAVAVPTDIFKQPDFQAVVASTLATMSSQPAPDMQPQIWKGGRLVDEERDTTHPGMVSALFFGYLSAFGKHADVVTVHKHMRDDVLWREAERPWRRSPTWTLIRVVLQVILSRHQPDGTHSDYKAFMASYVAQLLQCAQELDIKTDLQYVMSCKVARKLHKLHELGAGVPEKLQKALHSIQGFCSEFISKRWERIQESEFNASSEMKSLASLQFVQDTMIQLPELDHHITSRSEFISVEQPANSVLSHGPIRLSSGSIPRFYGQSSEVYHIAGLQNFDTWIIDLRSCITGNVDLDCHKLGRLIIEYHSTTKTSSHENPEAISMVLLNILEIWVTLDSIAVEACPLLAEYQTGVPAQILENLLLSSLDHMRRLRAVEEYLVSRKDCATLGSIFRGPRHRDCFANRYYEQDQPMKDLFAKLEARGRAGEAAKIAELSSLSQKYEELKREASKMAHNFDEGCLRSQSYIPREHRHLGTGARECMSCYFDTKADDMKILVHEWPLPTNQQQARSVVFELLIPEWYRSWRDCTTYLLHDVFQLKNAGDQRPENEFVLSADPHLAEEHNPGSEKQRIVLWTKTKPHVGTHRKRIALSKAKAENVCKSNSTDYQYFDNDAGYFIGRWLSTNTMPVLCTYSLPDRSKQLQDFLHRPAEFPDGPPPNAVIASQAACPAHMTVEEYRDLCSIPLGSRIQWYNILLQLPAPSVDFKKDETVLTLFQCVLQAGPNWSEHDSNDKITRASHTVLKHINFSRALLTNLDATLARVRGSWESGNALFVLASIAVRLLALSPDFDIQHGALDFLRRVRSMAANWLSTLRMKEQKTVDPTHRQHILVKCVEIALACGLTYDVGQTRLAYILADPIDASILLQAAITIGERRRGQSYLQSIIYARFQRVLWLAYPFISSTHVELDSAIRSVWSTYIPGEAGWCTLPGTTDFWLQTETSSSDHHESQIVQLNLVTGELLVDGCNLKALPAVYQAHPTYTALFREASVEVMASREPGMRFSARGEFGGYQVHLGITGRRTDFRRDLGRDLLVKAFKGPTALEIIPARLLRGKVPDHFVDDYVHWHDLQTGSLLLRPSNSPWDSSSQWSLIKDKTHNTWQLERGGTYVVGSRSATASQICRMLSPLAIDSKIHVLYFKTTGSLEIEIPQVQLGFRLQPGSVQLTSKQFPGMYVDSKQAVGALIGLSNKLLLKPLKAANPTLLVPEGVVDYEQLGDHVAVKVNLPSVVHAFEVDHRLARLVDNGSMQSKLYLAYLHALTAFTLPDPLTKRTGTEQALTILRSAAVHSFEQLSEANVDILVRLAHLTPHRCYYPPDARCMQTVQWNSQLSFMAQHGDFYNAVEAIFARAERTSMFYPESQLCIPALDHVVYDLLHRDLIRTAGVRVAGFGAEHHNTAEDHPCPPRDSELSRRATRASIVSRLISDQTGKLNWSAPKIGSLWPKFQHLTTVFAANQPVEKGMFRYDALLIHDSQQSIGGYILSLHRHLTARDGTPVDRFALAIWLSTIAFSKDADMELVQIVAMFYGALPLHDIQFPDIASMHPDKGLDPSLKALGKGIQAYQIKFEDTPAAYSQPKKLKSGSYRLETAEQASARQSRVYVTAAKNATNDLVKELLMQWKHRPRQRPNKLKSASDPKHLEYIDMEKAMRKVSDIFEEHWNNRQLKGFLDEVEQILNKLPKQVTILPDRAIRASTPACIESEAIEFASTESASTESASRESASRNSARTKHQRGYISLDDVFSGSNPQKCTQSSDSIRLPFDRRETAHNVSTQLSGMLKALEQSSEGQYEIQYVQDLRASANALQMRGDVEEPSRIVADKDKVTVECELQAHLASCKERLDRIYWSMKRAIHLTLRNISGDRVGLQWPRISPGLFLEQLGRIRYHKLKPEWQDVIAQYGLAITAVQRAERLLNAFNSDDFDDLVREYDNPGHADWDPNKSHEALLLEVESGIMIRKVQEDIASEMCDPSSGGNQVVQLNMGEGKSAVITPLVAAGLANGEQLVRIIVGKAQRKQMAYWLLAKLGGMLDRRVYYMPYSRALKLTKESAEAMLSLCEECMSNGGVLLLQPEHILSMALTGQES